MSPEREWPTEVKGIGIDITSIQRISRWLELYDQKTLALLFTSNELDCCQLAKNPAQAYAVCFATKEAIRKALGTGVANINWTDIEVNITAQKTTIFLSNQAMLQAKKQRVKNWITTWLCWDNYVFVHVLAL